MWESDGQGGMIMQYDDGSAAGYRAGDTSNVFSRDIGSSTWVDDPSPVFARDAVEQARMGQGYPSNGLPWDINAATLGVSRLIDSAARGYAVANGSMPGTYAGQNGLTYVNGRNGGGLYASGNLIPLLLIGGALLLLMK